MKKLLLTLTTLSIISLSNFVNAQAPNWAWAKNGIGSGDDKAYSVVSDISGNLIVVGRFDSPTITFGFTTLTNAGKYDMFIVKYDATGTVIWAKSVGGNGDDGATSVTADAAGNIIVAGTFSSLTITFGTTTLTNVNGPTEDMFIAKYDASGTVLWAKSAIGIFQDDATSVTTDNSGKIIVVGIFMSPTIAFDTTTLTNVGYSDIFIVKYDASGTLLWAKSEGGNDADIPNSVIVDASGNFIITGDFKSPTIIFGSTTLTNAGSYDMFIVKYDSSGTVLWAQSAGGSSMDEAYSVINDASGNLIVTGYFYSSTITLGSITLINAGSYDMFIVKYDSSGTILWAKSAGGSGDDEANSVTADASGNLIVAGWFGSSSITFGSTTLNNAGIWSTDICIVMYDATGTVVWAKSVGGSSSEGAYSVTADASGDLIVSGLFGSPTITFGSTTLTISGTYDIFIAKLDGTTGLESTQNTNGISVYPNPANDILTIRNGQLAIGKDVTISITDIAGKMIYNKTSIATVKMEVNTKDFVAGVYLVQVQTTDFVETRKVMKL